MRPETRTLEALAEEWERVARGKFSDAEHEKTDFGRRFIEHGAMCYVNCAQALREALGTMEVHSSAHNIAELETLRAAIVQTLNDNGHLADGDNCTLLALKVVLRKVGTPWDGDAPEDAGD